MLADARHDERMEHELYYEGGIGVLREVARPCQEPLFPEPITISACAKASASMSR